jgi:hypothetical protein
MQSNMKSFIPIAEDAPDIAESIRYNPERGVLPIAQAGLKGTIQTNMANVRSGPFGA